MEELITLLLHLVQKSSFLSEIERDAEVELLRKFEAHVGVAGIVPPAPGATNAPVETPTVDPGPVAEPVPAEQQPAPTFAAAVTPDANAFAP